MSAIFHYFLKEQCASWLFRTKYSEKKFSWQLFDLLIVSRTFFSHELPHAARLLKTCWFEKITVCVIETMLVTLPLDQMKKARGEVSQQIKYKSRKNCDNSLKVFKWLKKHFTTFQVVALCKSSCKSTYCNYLNPCKLQFFVNRVAVNLHIVTL